MVAQPATSWAKKLDPWPSRTVPSGRNRASDHALTAKLAASTAKARARADGGDQDPGADLAQDPRWPCATAPSGRWPPAAGPGWRSGEPGRWWPGRRTPPPRRG